MDARSFPCLYTPFVRRVRLQPMRHARPEIALFAGWRSAF